MLFGTGLLVSKLTLKASTFALLGTFFFGLAKFWDRILNILHTLFGVSGGHHCPHPTLDSRVNLGNIRVVMVPYTEVV